MAGMNEGEDSVPSPSSSSSESDSEYNNKLLNLIEETKSILETNPYHYESHIELIKLFRQSGDLDGARQARNNMADIFPLEESLWLEWIKDESSLISVPSAIQDLSQLYERSVQDYLSVPLWLEYIQFAIEAMSDGFDYAREIYEKAIIAVGLHTSQGGIIWNSYKDFEKAIFKSLQDMQASNHDDNDYKKQVEAQYDRLDNLYKRQLSIPLIGHEETFQEYQLFCDSTNISQDSLPNYTRAIKRLQVLLPYEEQLESSLSIETYQDYISKLIEVKEELTLINTLFQRAIALFPLNTDLWNQYLKYIDSEFTNIKEVLLKGHEQSVRNCPWVANYWIMYAQVLERMKESHEKIIKTFETAVGDNFTDGTSYLQVWTAYCDYLHRHTSNIESGEDERQAVRREFNRAREYLNTTKKSSDPQDTLSRYQASLEARCYDNMSEARSLWSDVMKRHGNQAQYWMEYIELERVYGDLNNCRKLFMMSVNSVSDDPERVCNAFLQFEREQGTLESFLTASKKCSTQLERIKERKEKALEVANNDKRSSGGNEGKKLRKGMTKTEQHISKQKESSSQSIKRKRKMEEQVFYTDDEVQRSKTIKIEDTATDNETKIEDTKAFPLIKSNQSQVSPVKNTPQTTTTTTGGGIEDNTVFVSNLTLYTTREQLDDMFSKCGQIHDIRLIKKSRGMGRPNVYAYVEYTSNEPIVLALAMDRSTCNDRPMYVSTCKSTTNTTSASEKQNKYNDKATVFVTNIAHDIAEKQLEEVFKEAGEIKGVRLVRNRQGRSKGFAYIEYMSESSTKSAILMLDGREMSGKGIKVAISNPPGNKSGPPATYQSGRYPVVPMETTDDIPNIRKQSLLGGPKTNISLLPRALARKKPSDTTTMSTNETNTAATTSDSVTVQKKTNEDFRKLLMKK